MHHINMNIEKKLNFKIQIKINELRHSIHQFGCLVCSFFSTSMLRTHVHTYIQSHITYLGLYAQQSQCNAHMNIFVFTLYDAHFTHTQSSMQHIFNSRQYNQHGWKKPEKSKLTKKRNNKKEKKVANQKGRV